MVDSHTCSLYGLHQIEDFVDRVQVGACAGDLRAYVAINADHLQARQRGCMQIAAQRVFMGNAKLIAFQACRNIGVGLRVDVGVDANAHGSEFAAGERHLTQHIEFGFALHIEAGDSRIQRLAHLGAGFAHARKNHFIGLPTSGQHAREFAARDNVKATTGLGKHLQHRQRGVGFHGVMHLCVAPRESALVRS